MEELLITKGEKGLKIKTKPRLFQRIKIIKLKLKKIQEKTN